MPDDAPTPANGNPAVLCTTGTPDSNGNPYTVVDRIDPRNDAGTSGLTRALNDNGLVVGRIAISATAGDETAFVYHPGDTELTSFSFLNGERTDAIDIGPNNWIVGYVGPSEGDPAGTDGGPSANRAVRWLPSDS